MKKDDIDALLKKNLAVLGEIFGPPSEEHREDFEAKMEASFNAESSNVVRFQTPDERHGQLVGEVVSYLEFQMYEGASFEQAVQGVRAMFDRRDLEKGFALI